MLPKTLYLVTSPTRHLVTPKNTKGREVLFQITVIASRVPPAKVWGVELEVGQVWCEDEEKPQGRREEGRKDWREGGGEGETHEGMARGGGRGRREGGGVSVRRGEEGGEDGGATEGWRRRRVVGGGREGKGKMEGRARVVCAGGS